MALAAWVPPGNRGQPRPASQLIGRLVFTPPGAFPLGGRDEDYSAIPVYAEYANEPPASGGTKRRKEVTVDLERSTPGQAIEVVLKPPAIGDEKDDEEQQQDKNETEEPVDFGDEEADKREPEKRKEEDEQRPPRPTPKNGSYWTYADEKYNEDIRKKYGEKPFITEAVYEAKVCKGKRRMHKRQTRSVKRR